MDFKSKLNEVIQQVYGSTTVDEAKQLFLDCVNDSKINDYSKHRMVTTVGTLQTLKDVQTYATNSMFMYEGLGVGKKRRMYETAEKKTKTPANATNIAAVVGNLEF